MPVDTDKHVSFVLLSSPSYSGIMDLMAGARAPACMCNLRVRYRFKYQGSLHAQGHTYKLGRARSGLSPPSSQLKSLDNINTVYCSSGLDFAYPEAAKIGGLASGPAQRAPAPVEEAPGGPEPGPRITIAGAPRRAGAGAQRGWPLVCWSASR